jgi:hypothetical protein
MDCRTARLLLHFTGRPAGELDPAESGDLQGHLGDCPECQDLAEAERRLDDRLGRAMREVPVPESLRGAVLTRLGASRDALYRAWLVRAAGVAAVLALVAWLGWHWLDRRPAVTLNEVIASAERIGESQVDQWLREVNGELSAPPDFDPHKLAGYGFADVDGRRVPVLTYVVGVPGGGVAWAHVYLFADRRFDLDELRRQGAGSGLGVTAEVHEYEARPGVVYVMVFTGDDLQRFKRPPEHKPPAV